jgi:hypothetical protein
MRKKFLLAIGVLLPLLLLTLITTSSIWYPQRAGDQARRYTRPFEFDYFYWTMQSLWEKSGQATLSIESGINSFKSRAIILDFLDLIQQIHDLDQQILQVYSNPEITNPAEDAKALITQKERAEAAFTQQRLLAESILQSQISAVLTKNGLIFIQSPFPPVLFKITSLPDQLILSPRSVIREEASISLEPGLSDQQKDELEKNVSDNLDMSALVVPLGGVGVYPTMVYREASLEYLIRVIAHEWIHNYLAFKPLGWHYDASPQLRTMNETTAELCATEISQSVLRSFYAEPSSTGKDKDVFAVSNNQNESFNFNKEMHATRVAVDELLAQGKIEEAEKLMEEKRGFFWENGYQIRKLNQAYFAFYGAYADKPLGAAGNDPVGPAVRALREKSRTMQEFLKRISVMTSFEALQKSISD